MVDNGTSSLKHCEKDVVRSLENADLKSLLLECMSIRAIPQALKTNFESLDPEAVPRPLMVRYLLLHVYEWLDANPRLYERWLKVLGRYVVSLKRCEKGNFERPSRVGHGTNCLLENHVSVLTEVLAGHSSEWMNIGVSLRLPNNVLKDIITTYGQYGGNFCLNQLLYEWIVGTHEHARSPTVDNLKEALRSVIVGLGTVADQIDGQLFERGISLGGKEWSSLQKQPWLETPPVEIVSQSCDITVVEGKSALLEVQVETRDQTNISYQWLKDGLPLEEGGEFSGVATPILYLRAAHRSVGTYKCVVKFCLYIDSVVSSEPILVQISLPPLKKILVDRYCAQPEIPADSWPPQSSNTYINLALIKPGMIGEYARCTIQGDMDDILASKESIEYEAVFSDLKSETCLLIEGRPGSGKTTLVHKFSQDWGRGEHRLCLDSVELLFLVHLRGFFNDPNVKLQDIVKCYYTESSMVEEVMQYASQHSGEGLCFILDGLDEYNPTSKDNTFVFKLIKRELLPKAVVLVASRPAATAKLRRTATKRVEVLGFLKEQIYQYVENYIFSEVDSSIRADLHKYLDEHPNVRHMCYLPIHCAMVCFLFDIMGSCLPHTETEMYTEFTKHTLLRTLTRSGVDSLNSPESLPSKEKEIFRLICKLGFEKTIASKQLMKKSELCFFMDVASGSESLGLITVDRMASKCGFDSLYSFLHLTFQEYLAAYHISMLAEDEQLRLINSKRGRNKHMYVVWKFYCGLVKFQNDSIHKFVQIMASMSNSLKGDLYSVQCAFESQRAITCDSIVRFGESGTLSFVDVKTPSDFTSIVYVLSNSTTPVEKVVFDRCDFGALEIRAGSQEHSKLQTLELKRCIGGFENAAGFLKRCCDLKTLHVYNGRIVDRDGAKAFAESLKLCPHLQTIEFLETNFPKALAESLKYCLNLKTLNLGENAIGEYGAKALADSLKHCPNLQTLELWSNMIGVEGAKVIADALKHCPDFNELDLRNNSIGDDGAKALAIGLRCCPSLQTLYLAKNCIGDNGAKAIGDALKHCPDLKTLDLNSNSIGDDGAKVLAVGLRHCPSLQTLSISFNSIGDDGARALAIGLSHCPNLQTLNLHWNSIGDDGAKALAENLKNSPDFRNFLLLQTILVMLVKKLLLQVSSTAPSYSLRIDKAQTVGRGGQTQQRKWTIKLVRILIWHIT